MKKIKHVLISGGTHGNELSGTQFVSYYLRNATKREQFVSNFSDLSIDWVIANPEAMDKNRRFVEEDLNRQFLPTLLNNEIHQEHSLQSKERAIALALNDKYGPKGAQSKTDFVIDIHNTTSNMGPTLILLESDLFHQQLARYVKSKMPSAVILIEDEKPFYEHKYLCTLGKRGVMIEVGPQPQGALFAEAYLQTQEMCLAILEFCEHSNEQGLFIESPIEAYRLLEEISYPKDDMGNISAMIHPSLQHADFQPLVKGQAIFLSFENEDILYQGEDVIYPHFIGEAAYFNLGIAFAAAQKFLF